jgi:hypothetical protein
MATILFRFPDTGYCMQGWSGRGAVDTAETYESVSCYACRQMHSVNPTTGKVLGGDEE